MSTSTSTSTSTATGKPAPLQAHAAQEQSPVVGNDGKLDDGKVVKPVNVVPTSATGVKVPPKVAVGKAKRGLKRL
jgi:hypothetical protein